MNEVITTTTPSIIDSLSAFLKYGPIGLAGLMLTLVIIALRLTIDPSRERLLRQFMYLGAACFALALGGNTFSLAEAYYVKDLRAQNSQQRRALSEVASNSDKIMADLEKIPGLLDKNCSGEGHGVPARSNPAVLAVSSNAISWLVGYKAYASGAIAVPDL